jgi:hypothetical protein
VKRLNLDAAAVRDVKVSDSVAKQATRNSRTGRDFSGSVRIVRPRGEHCTVEDLWITLEPRGDRGDREKLETVLTETPGIEREDRERASAYGVPANGKPRQRTGFR